MRKMDFGYKKNFGLLISSAVFITVLFVVSVLLAKSMISNFVVSEFNNRKVEVFDESIKPFNEFFFTKIPEISYYQGYLDSVQATAYTNSVIRKYAFVERVVFYDILFSNNDSLESGIKFNNLIIHSKNIVSYHLSEENRLIVERKGQEESKQYADDFNNTALKLVSFLDRVNDTTRLTDNDIYKVFYTLNPGKIAYMNIPRISDLASYKVLMTDDSASAVTYDQDLFVFHINPQKINISNPYPNLYESIRILPIVEGKVEDTRSYMQTDLPMPGALSDYKLQFDTSEGFIAKETNRRFLPVVFGLCLLYFILLSLVYFIFRNVSTNNKLYHLQYDFINNLTHEFKTPVSVIKIAGNNIKSAQTLTIEEKDLYGRILDQEADKLNNLMNTLLSFTQIENKSIRFKKESIDLHELSERLFSANKLKYPDLKLTYHVGTTRRMQTDQVLLTSVFQNLIDNAYKYSNPGNKQLDVDIQQNKRNFVIIFKDNGIGISKKEFNNIFKKFYRVKNQFNQQGSIGLGLAFCKEITEFMGGEIKVDSQLNVGTVFTLIFPLA